MLESCLGEDSCEGVLVCGKARRPERGLDFDVGTSTSDSPAFTRRSPGVLFVLNMLGGRGDGEDGEPYG